MSVSKSYLLVGTQFGLLAFLAWYGGVSGGVFPGVVLAVATALGLWAIAAMRFRVHVFPEVRPTQRLFTGGPYRFLRHPMYTAVLLAGASWVMNRPDVWSMLAWAVLLADLLVKLSYEERLLRERFPEYAAYARRSSRLIPFIY